MASLLERLETPSVLDTVLTHMNDVKVQWGRPRCNQFKTRIAKGINMHRTSSTDISDTLDKVQQLNERLQDSEWMPEEERFGTVCAGVIVVQTIQDGFDIGMFTEDEIELINEVATLCDEIARDITADDQI
jgi:hypothetical protein